MELAKTKVQFYEELEDRLGGSISRANSVQDLNCEEPLKNIEPKRMHALLRNQWKETESWKLRNINLR